MKKHCNLEVRPIRTTAWQIQRIQVPIFIPASSTWESRPATGHAYIHIPQKETERGSRPEVKRAIRTTKWRWSCAKSRDAGLEDRRQSRESFIRTTHTLTISENRKAQVSEKPDSLPSLRWMIAVISVSWMTRLWGVEESRTCEQCGANKKLKQAWKVWKWYGILTLKRPNQSTQATHPIGLISTFAWLSCTETYSEIVRAWNKTTTPAKKVLSFQ